MNSITHEPNISATMTNVSFSSKHHSHSLFIATYLPRGQMETKPKKGKNHGKIILTRLEELKVIDEENSAETIDKRPKQQICSVPPLCV